MLFANKTNCVIFVLIGSFHSCTFKIPGSILDTVVSNLSDTGQTLCYNNSTAQACGNSAFPGQDGDYADIPRARSLTGPAQNTSFTNDYTTSDKATGLVWKSCSEGQSGSDCLNGGASSITFATASGSTCTSLNILNSGAGYAGITAWRLPSIEELQTLTNYSGVNPAIDGTNFPNTANFTPYWSSTTYAANVANAWYVYLNDGGIASSPKAGPLLVRCVSGPTFFHGPYHDNNDSTISDYGANLRWQKCSMGLNNDTGCTGSGTTVTWSVALNYCQNLSLAGKTWRLPNASELHNLVDSLMSNPAISSSNFPGTASLPYWSSSTYGQGQTQAWYVLFDFGTLSNTLKSTLYYVRCVATGP